MAIGTNAPHRIAKIPEPIPFIFPFISSIFPANSANRYTAALTADTIAGIFPAIAVATIHPIVHEINWTGQTVLPIASGGIFSYETIDASIIDNRNVTPRLMKLPIAIAMTGFADLLAVKYGCFFTIHLPFRYILLQQAKKNTREQLPGY